MVAPVIIQRGANFVRRIANRIIYGPSKPTAYEQSISQSVAGDRVTRRIGPPGSPARRAVNTLGPTATALQVGAGPLVGAGVASRGVMSSVGRGFATVGRYLAPSFTPSIIAKRGLAYLGLVEAFRGSRALQKTDPSFGDFFPTAGQLAGAPFVGIFPPSALLGGVLGKGQQEAVNLGKQFTEVYQSFMPQIQPLLPSGLKPFIPDVEGEVNIPSAPSYTGGTTEVNLVAPPSSTVVSVGGGGSDPYAQAILFSLLAGGSLGYLFGRRKRKRKRYKGRRHKR